VNKQIITIATASFLWLAAVHIALAKKARGGRREPHAARESNSPNKNTSMRRLPNLPRRSKRTQKILVAMRTAARRIVKAHALLRRREIQRCIDQISSAMADFAKYVELAPKDAPAYVERGETEVELKQYDAALLI